MMRKLLRVDLSSGTAQEEPIPDTVGEAFVGCRGLAAHYLYRELSPGADPLGRHNKLLLAAGPLAGTGALSAAKWMAVTKSPLSGTFTRAIGGDAREIVFTSGGTEAINLALKGAAWAGRAKGHRIVTTPVEHHAVGHALAHLEKFGFEVEQVPVDRYGRVDPADVERAITERTVLVSVMAANNEVGTIQPVAEVAQVVRGRKGVLFHVDAVQAAPWQEIDVEALGADLVSLAAHKIEGPK